MWWLWLLAILGAFAAVCCGALALLVLRASGADDGEEY